MSAGQPTYQEVVDRLRNEILMESSTNRWTDQELMNILRDEASFILMASGLPQKKRLGEAVADADLANGYTVLSSGAASDRIARNGVYMGPDNDNMHRLIEAPHGEVIDKQRRLPATTSALAPEIYSIDEDLVGTAEVRLYFAPLVTSTVGTWRVWITYHLNVLSNQGGFTLASNFDGTNTIQEHMMATLWRAAARIYHAGGETQRFTEAQAMADFYARQFFTMFAARPAEAFDNLNAVNQFGGPDHRGSDRNVAR